MAHKTLAELAADLNTALSTVASLETTLEIAEQNRRLLNAKRQVNAIKSALRTHIAPGSCVHLTRSGKVIFVNERNELIVLDVVGVNE